MGAMKSSGSSVMPLAGVPQGDLEETAKTVNLSRPRGEEKSKTLPRDGNVLYLRYILLMIGLIKLGEWEGGGGGVILGVNGVPR